MFGRKSVKKVEKLSFDPARQKPVLKCSICTGEQVAGLKDLSTGKFQEVMVIRNQEDLEIFQKMTGQTNFEKEY